MRATKAGRPYGKVGLSYVIALVVLACAPAPAGSGDSPAAPPAATPPIRLRAGYPSVAPSTAASWWMAQDAGYFREQGLEVDLTHITSGAAAMLSALQTGELEFGGSSGAVMIGGHLEGLDVVMVGSSSNVLDAVLFTRPEIERPAELRGQTIGVSQRRATTDIGARLALQRFGLAPDVDVTIVPTGGQPESLAAVEIGIVAGASVAPPIVFEARKRGYRELVNVTDLRLPYPTGGFWARQQLLNERPELGERTLRALAQGVNRLMKDRAMAMQVIGRNSHMDDSELLSATVDYYTPLYAPDLAPDPTALQVVLDNEERPAARSTQPEQLIDARFAERLHTTGFLDQLPK